MRTEALDLGGTIRSMDVAATLSRARKFFRTFGISRVGNVTGLDHIGVPTWIAVRPLSRSQTVSQGKGLTHALAQASGVMESIELYHAENFTPRGHVQSLRGAVEDPIYVNPLLLPVRPSARLRDDSRTEWIEGTDVLSGEARWVPRDCVNLDSVATADHEALFVSSSNGLASGNTFVEAILHALCEVVERDQATMWLARQQFQPDAPATRLCLDQVADEHCKWLIDKCVTAGVRLAAWRITQDLGVPCFKCTAFDSTGRTFYPQRSSGFGCHPYRRIALARAITEALQSRLTCIAGGREDITWRQYRDKVRIDNNEGARWASGLDAEVESICLAETPEAPQQHTIDELLDWVLAALKDADLSQAIVVDLTQEQFGIPAVHVTVPGLEGLLGMPGYTPGPRMQTFLARHLDM